MLVVNVENLLASATSQFVSVHRADQSQASPPSFYPLPVPGEAPSAYTETNEAESEMTGEEEKREAEIIIPKEGKQN